MIKITLSFDVDSFDTLSIDDKSSFAKIISGNTSQILLSEEIKKQIEKGNIIGKPIN